RGPARHDPAASSAVRRPSGPGPGQPGRRHRCPADRQLRSRPGRGAATVTVRALSSAAVHADHAARAQKDPRALAPTLLRRRSVAGREVLAHLAGLGRLSSAEIAALPGQGLDARAVRNRLDPQWAGELARVLALQTGELADQEAALGLFDALAGAGGLRALGDRKSTRLNSSHVSISYAVFCLKKKK